MPPDTHTHALPVRSPFRLDLTVSALRRLRTNVVNVLSDEGHFLRALEGERGPLLVRARQVTPESLEVTVQGAAREQAAAIAAVQRMLGVERDLTLFERAAARLPWLRALARRMRGVKPPRFPTLWESCVNAIVFQQVSLAAATTVTRRLVRALGTRLELEGMPLYAFPGPERFLAARDDALRAAGLSAQKLATLRRAAEAIEAGTLDERALEALPSAEAAARLRELKGIGPWTAVVILLRGLGRLDVFPMNDSGVVRNLALASGLGAEDIPALLHALEPQQGMLYFMLLLARLEASGELGAASIAER